MSRVTYTVFGDSVNATQRLESLGKEVAPNEEVAVAFSLGSGGGCKS